MKLFEIAEIFGEHLKKRDQFDDEKVFRAFEENNDLLFETIPISSKEELDKAIKVLIPYIELDFWVAGRAANTCGLMVESGGSAAIACDAIAARLIEPLAVKYLELSLRRKHRALSS